MNNRFYKLGYNQALKDAENENPVAVAWKYWFQEFYGYFADTKIKWFPNKKAFDAIETIPDKSIQDAWKQYVETRNEFSKAIYALRDALSDKYPEEID